MAQFFTATAEANYNGTICQNTFAWFRNSTGLPNLGDQTAVADYIQNSLLPKFTPLQSSVLSWKKISVQSWSDTWVREPYLPYIRDISINGTQAVPCAPPVLAVVISFRLKPVANHPVKNKPVVRGYISVAGFPEADLNEDGLVSSGLRGSVPMGALLTELNTDWLPPTGVEVMNPIRTGAPVGRPVGSTLPVDERRGWSQIEQARVNIAISTRRSRKYGKGV